MREMVETLKKLLLSDWNDVNFVIGTNPSDNIEMKFEVPTLDSVLGLHCYMNTLLYSNEELIHFQLRKVPHFWGYKEDNFVYYMLSPPWNRFFVNDIVNQSVKIPRSDVKPNRKPTLFSKEIQIQQSPE